MRIGCFTDYYLPSSAGVTVSIETFRKKIEKMGHKFFIFAPGSKGYTDKNPNVYRFKAFTLSKKRNLYLALPFTARQLNLKRIFDLKLDVIHAQSPFTIGLIGKYVSLKQKIPFIYTHHTHLEEYAKFYFKEKFITPYIAKVWSGRFCNFSDAVIVPSKKIENSLKGYGVKKEIIILPTGVDTKLFKSDKKQKNILRKKLGVSPKTKILLFVGRMEDEKNPLFLIKALKEILKKRNDVVLLMIGDGSCEKKAEILAKKLKIPESVKCTGKVPYSTMPSYYQGSDIFCFSSLTETQGIVLLEAESVGLPIVALKDNAFENVVENNKNGFLVKEHNSPKIFANYVSKILNNPKLYRKFSLASKKIAKSFSQEKQAKELLRIYRDVIVHPKKMNASRTPKILKRFGIEKSL